MTGRSSHVQALVLTGTLTTRISVGRSIQQSTIYPQVSWSALMKTSWYRELMGVTHCEPHIFKQWPWDGWDQDLERRKLVGKPGPSPCTSEKQNSASAETCLEESHQKQPWREGPKTAGWFSLLITFKLKIGPSWQAENLVKVAGSLHRWTSYNKTWTQNGDVRNVKTGYYPRAKQRYYRRTLWWYQGSQSSPGVESSEGSEGKQERSYSSERCPVPRQEAMNINRNKGNSI